MNHLGNVLTTISDKKFGVQNPSDTNYVSYYNAAIITASDYYPFGMKTNRNYYGAAYNNRYGFNGKENDREVKGDGNQYDYGMRIYDPRVGRFLSVDPLTGKFAKLTPYQYASNRPTVMIDLDGMEGSMGLSGSANVTQQGYSMVEFDSDGDWKPNYNKGWATGLMVTLTSGYTVLSLGTSFAAGSFALKPMLANMLRLGVVGSAVSSTISYAKGDNGYEITKSAVSGFFSGATLALPWAKTLQGVIVAGGMSGSIGEITNQAFDNLYGTDKGFSLEKTMISGGIGAVANVLAGTIVDKITQALDQQLTKNLVETETATFREGIKKAILERAPNIGRGNQLKQAINADIKEIQTLLKKQTDVNKAAAQKAIERGVDYLQDKSNEILKSANDKNH